MKLKKLDVASLSQRVGLNDGVLVLRPMAKKMFEASRTEVGDLMSDEVLVRPELSELSSRSPSAQSPSARSPSV